MACFPSTQDEVLEFYSKQSTILSLHVQVMKYLYYVFYLSVNEADNGIQLSDYEIISTNKWQFSYNIRTIIMYLYRFNGK